MADKILADPSRRRLFEKDDIFSLICAPQAAQNSLETTNSHSKEEDELPVQKYQAKCIKISRKNIQKDKKLQKYFH